MLKSTVAAFALLMATDASVALAQTAPAAQAPAQTEDQRLAAFFDQAFREALAQSPEGLTQLGSKERYGELGDYTDAANQKSVALGAAQVARMKREFDYAKLSPSSQMSWRLFEEGQKTAELLHGWRFHQFAVTNNGTAISGVPVMLINSHRVDSVEDAQAYVSRLRAVERVGGEVAGDLNARTGKGLVSPSFVFEPVLADARAQLTGAPFDGGADHPVWADFKKKVAALNADQAVKDKLLAEGGAALTGEYRRGVEAMIGAVEAMGAKAKSTDGVWRLPDGDAYYAAAVKFFTTTDLTPAQVHDIGLSEVARIHKEMEAIKTKVGFKGTLEQFFQHVKTDPKFKYPNTDEGKAQYLADATAIVNKYMAEAAGRQFSTLPKGPVEVRKVEPWREKTASVAFYNPGTPDGSRPGIYYVNLSDMTQVQKVQLEAITFHEAAPGHHFQIARSMEQADLPMFRRLSYQGAYIEGWGLYAEKLGKEAGFYTDPYSDFGRLSLELWRAGRLVVDTGLHAKRWSREQAIQYFRDNTLMSELDIAREIDRYISNPGQATSYKIGQLKILELRDKAQKALGPKFDLKGFHEVVLGNGALPLGVLEQQVDAWIAAKRKG
ncbi:MAG TPA: DUF885 domain-containing protein [Caulobacteraceae bacterium]|nr:DUF885 domain-containing protein [Caulobacteraceae bacterium]